MSERIYGYCRVSTHHQKIERQVENIKSRYPDAVIIQETYTGTTTDRPVFSRMLKNLQPGDTVVFDEISRMSRDAKEGADLYRELYGRGINLIFLKESYLDTQVYRETTQSHVKMTGTDVDIILSAVNEYLMVLAERQIERAFLTSEKEVQLLHKRTSEGVRRAQIQGKQVGRAKGTIVETKKAKEVKPLIKEHARDFGGTLTDEQCMKMVGVARNTYYKYKREIKNAYG